MRFKIDWASLIVGSKFTVFALFYFVFEGNFPSKSPRGAYIWRGDFANGFLRYQFGGLIFGGAYFRNFTVSLNLWLTEYYLQRVHVIHWLDCGVGCIPDYNQNYNKQGYAPRKKIRGAQNTNPLTFWLPSIVILGKN